MKKRGEWALGLSTCFYRRSDEAAFEQFRRAGVEVI